LEKIEQESQNIFEQQQAPLCQPRTFNSVFDSRFLPQQL